MPTRPAQRVYRTWIIDSTRWDRYRPRPGDVVIATYPKCGTTWMQRIMDLLVFQTPEPRSIPQVSPWIDRRFPEPLEAVMARVEAQAHRRFLKAHLPADGLPLHDEVRYIHVARDGRDACLSFHHFASGFEPGMLAALGREGMADPAINRPYPLLPADPADFFHLWLTEGAVPGHADGSPSMSYFHFERSWWEERRRRPDVLLVHYADLKADLAGEMRRVADHLGVAVAEETWPALVEAAGFKAMRREGAAIMTRAVGMLEGGADRFFHRGEVGRWRGVFREEDLALYEAKLEATLPPACRQWLAEGRLRAGDPDRRH
jgi:aryl sulfotransferase